jgi:hypothetical protein
MTTVTTIDELLKDLDANFEVRHVAIPENLKTNFYVFDAVKQEGRDVGAQLVDRMKHEFDLLKAMGAKVIVLKDAPASIDLGDHERIQASFNAHDANGSLLVTGYEVVEGAEPPIEKPKPTIAEIEQLIADHGSKNVQLNTDGTVTVKAAPIAIAGYDLVEDKDEAVLLCALLVHNTVKALNDAFNEYTLSWVDNKASIIAGVKRTLANPNETPEDNHAAWMEFKTIEGWSYGPNKDEKLEEHPCMVPYEALGPHARSKDAIFQTIVRTFFGL